MRSTIIGDARQGGGFVDAPLVESSGRSVGLVVHGGTLRSRRLGGRQGLPTARCSRRIAAPSHERGLSFIGCAAPAAERGRYAPDYQEVTNV